ncbi:MAG: hypothetical protein H6832_16895 [Planctomycetes bacterium]|nr:hypothetical protein [Planctomycetota bacterium]MCB9920080.1 hypothetical protein [Planctomycetota bacterium]
MATKLTILIAIVCIVRSVILAGTLVFDDLHSVVYNPSIQSFANIKDWFTNGQSFSSVQGIHAFRPLVLMTLALDHQLFGGAAWGFRFGNLVQHACACVLAFQVMRALFPRAGCDATTTDRAALIGTALFGLHPIHVETLGLASSRSEILATIGLWIALRGHLANPQSAGRRAAWIAAGTMVALGAKMTGILVPAVVVLVEVVLPSDRSLRTRILGTLRTRVVSLIPVLASLPVIVVWYLGRANAMGARIAPNPTMMSNPLYGAGRGMATQLEGAAFFVPKAFWIWLWPSEMTIDHTEFFGLGLTSGPTIAGALFVVLVLGFATSSFFRRPILTISVWGAFAFVLPWIVFPLNMPLAEHRLYPVAFFFGLAPSVFAARWWGERTSARVEPTSRARLSRVVPRRIASVVTTGVLLALTARTVVWSYAWRDDRRLWETCKEHSPESFYVWANLAKCAAERGDLLGAVRANERAHGIFGAKRPVLLALVESRLNALRAAPRGDGFVDATKRRLSDLCERWPDRWRGAMHLSEFSEVMNDGKDVNLARLGAAWGLSMVEIEGRLADSSLYAARAARAGGDRLAALVILDDALQATGEQAPTQAEANALRAERCRVLVESHEFDEASRELARLRTSIGPAAPMDRHVLEVEACFHRTRGNRAALARTLEVMRRLGHGTSGLDLGSARSDGAKPD